MAQRYTDEFKRDAVPLLRARGVRTVADIAKSLGVSESMLYRWSTAQAEPLAEAAAQRDVEALRRQVRALEQENAFLNKSVRLLRKRDQDVIAFITAEKAALPT